LYFSSMKSLLFLCIIIICHSEGFTQENAVAAIPNRDSNEIVADVTMEAGFKGGAKAWFKFISDSADLNKIYAKGVERTPVTVFVNFIVYKNGTVSDVKAYGKAPDCAKQEAVRLINSSSGLWIPGEYWGDKVHSRKMIPLKFTPPGIKQ
jgi:periplasmic protein TonB